MIQGRALADLGGSIVDRGTVERPPRRNEWPSGEREAQPMPRTILNSAEVAAALGLDVRAIERLAGSGELPGREVGGVWRFRSAEVAEWAGQHLGAFPTDGLRCKAPADAELLIRRALQPTTVAVPLAASTRASVLGELVALAERSGQVTDPRALLKAVVERERQHSTALPGGVAIPHGAQVGSHVLDWPVIAAGRADHGIPFGDAGGDLTDMFFLLCCTDYRQHLVYLGRLSRLLTDALLLDRLREVETPEAFAEALWNAEEKLCRVA